MCNVIATEVDSNRIVPLVGRLYSAVATASHSIAGETAQAPVITVMIRVLILPPVFKSLLMLRPTITPEYSNLKPV